MTLTDTKHPARWLAVFAAADIESSARSPAEDPLLRLARGRGAIGGVADANDIVGSGRTRGIAAMIEGFFAIMWFGWGQATPPSWLSTPLAISSAAGAVVAIAGLVLTIRSKGQHTAMGDAAVRRRYNIIVGLEFGLLAAGAAVLGVTGLTLWITVWVCAGVGVHFVPLSNVFRHLLLVPVGLLITAVAVAALIVGLSTSVAPSTITGPGAGICLLAAGIIHLSGRLPGHTHQRRRQ